MTFRGRNAVVYAYHSLVHLCCRALDGQRVYMVLNGPWVESPRCFSDAFLLSRFDSVGAPRP